MNQRVVLQIRLSKRWVEHSQEPVDMLANFLFSFYTFLGLADPSAAFKWELTNGHNNVPYLILFEELPLSEEEVQEDEFTPPSENSSPDDPSDRIFTEDDLNPDIVHDPSDH